MITLNIQVCTDYIDHSNKNEYTNRSTGDHATLITPTAPCASTTHSVNFWNFLFTSDSNDKIIHNLVK